ncbi:Ca2+-binding RTX toxin-like protein [Nitrosomonas ureae]|uniref:DUF4347 domain-containing protein n=1 Tax=Nitrosomonas ureae TaxID=44577 RepID=UPI000D76C628|nr:DUF4347 domain-containing protein [Nitrosomonas ureae]PXX09490.1 Ca2+-binding RTX toxin-like protein [Nitrosomonas ureae]
MNNRIAFIDSHITNYQTLIAQLPQTTEAILLNVERDGIEQILAALQGKANLSTIDIITHGSSGTITLGPGVLNNSNIYEYTEQLAQVGQHLTEDGDILLYGCEVAKGQAGQTFIERLAQLTHAHVAASTNLTGSAELNGDWALEVHRGTIKTEALQFAYDGVLAIINGTSGNDTLTGTTGDDILTGDAGNDLLIGGDGNDVARFLGNHDEYQLSTDETGRITIRDENTANGDEGTDTFDDPMALRFADGDYAANVVSRGGEFRVNTTTDNFQEQPTITALADGGFVASWRSFNQDRNGNYGIYAQRYDENGVTVGGEFKVNTTAAFQQSNPSITSLINGGFVVSWHALNQSGDSLEIFMQRFNVDGTMQGGELRVNTTTANGQFFPTITALNDGGFVVSWESDNQDGSGFGIYAQRYNASGMSVGGEFRVNNTTDSSQEQPAITALNDGGFVVIWQSFNQDGSYFGIYAQRYNASGVTIGGEFQVNTTTFYEQESPTITSLAEGGFVVSWASTSINGIEINSDIYAQRYDASGVVVGGEFRVNTTTANYQGAPKITALVDGGFVASWTSFNQDGSGYGIYAQRYKADGAVQGGEFRVNTIADNHQWIPTITALNDGGFVVSWQSFQGINGYDIYAQRYDANGNPVQSVVQLSPLNTGTNQTPVLNTTLVNQAVKFGNTLNYNAGTSFSDPDGDTLSFSAILANGDPLPAWMQINAGTGVISGTPNVGDRDTYSLSVKATDPHGLNVTTLVTVAVTSFDAGNLLVSTPGNDTLAGTASNDTVTYGYATAPVAVSLAIATQQNTVGAGLDTLIAIDNLIGSDFNDNLTGNGQNNALEGGGGNDTLNGAGGADTMVGGSGNDTFVVNNIGDVVTEFLNEGTDKVNSNIAYTLPVNIENLTLTGTLAINGTGNNLNNVIAGNSADNQLNGQAGNDTLNGGGGNDTLIGWSGTDIMTGGAGNDTYFVENTGDVVTEFLNAGTDIVSTRLTYTLPNNVENLILTGTAAVNGTGNALANVITGNTAANQLAGLTGNDTLNGGSGNDILDGGTGTNILTGGSGNDLFKFTTAGHIDSITDFNVVNDTIQLENAVFTALTTPGTLAAGQFRVGTQAQDNNDFVIYNNVTGALLFDANGNGIGAAVQIATLSAGLAMTNADIVVI